MIEAAARWTARGISLLVLGPLAAWGGGLVSKADGSVPATLLTGASVGAGLPALAVVAGCLLAAAVVGARLGDRHEAVLNLGFVLAWVAWSGGRMEQVFRVSTGSGPLVLLAVEGLMIAVLVLGSCVVADRFSRRTAEAEGLSTSVSSLVGALRFKAGAPVAGVAMAAGLASAWLFARYGGAGQGLGSAFLGGVLGGALAAQTYESLKKNEKSTPLGSTGVVVPALVGLLLAGAVAPLIGIASPGPGRLLEGIARGTLPGWVLVSPASWAAGAMLGIPMGVSLLRSAGKQSAEGVGTRATPRGSV
jgi:hypothetical protein